MLAHTLTCSFCLTALWELLPVGPEEYFWNNRMTETGFLLARCRSAAPKVSKH